MKMIVSGGGTGGHIYPALSLVDYMEKNIPSHEALYVGTEEGLESQIVTKKEYHLNQYVYRDLSVV